MDIKECVRCKEDKATSTDPEQSEFAWRKGRQCFASECRECHKEYNRNHYRENKQYYVDKARKHNAEYKLRIYQWLFDYFKSHPCMDCGETNPIVLEFDHLDSADKEVEVSVLLGQQSLRKVQLEVKKCDVRCSNCHKKRTAIQNNWFWVKFLQTSP